MPSETAVMWFFLSGYLCILRVLNSVMYRNLEICSQIYRNDGLCDERPNSMSMPACSNWNDGLISCWHLALVFFCVHIIELNIFRPTHV